MQRRITGFRSEKDRDRSGNRPRWCFPTNYSWKLLAFPKQIRHGAGGCIAGMVKAGQLEAAFDGAKQGEMIVERPALPVVCPVVSVHDSDHLVDDGLHRVVVFVPDHDDGVMAFLPGTGAVNGLDDLLHK